MVGSVKTISGGRAAKDLHKQVKEGKGEEN